MRPDVASIIKLKNKKNLKKQEFKVNMKIQLINYTRNPEETVAQSARVCYSAKSIREIAEFTDRSAEKKLIKKIMRLGHFSVLEHVSFTFGIEDISRVATHQLVRHRIASFSQRSQRYVKVGKEQGYIIPPAIQNNRELLLKFQKQLSNNHDLYQEMVEKDIPAEDARYILSQAINTSIIFTANARELIHFFRLRCCNRAQWEIRGIAIEMLKMTKKIAPTIFNDAGPPCLIGPCPEGEMSCGHPWKKRKENEKAV